MLNSFAWRVALCVCAGLVLCAAPRAAYAQEKKPNITKWLEVNQAHKHQCHITTGTLAGSHLLTQSVV